MDHIFFYRASFADVLTEWMWIALWVYVGMRIERRRARKLGEKAVSFLQAVEPTLDDASQGNAVGDRKS
jgi:hypothetical protein